MKEKKIILYLQPLATVFCNLLLAYVLYFVARIVFLLTNYSFYEGHLEFPHLMEMLGGGLVFDTSAILVTNIPYIVFLLLTPWRKLAQWTYIIINAVAFAINLADCVYFRFTMRRTTTTVFDEFQNENNIAGVICTELINHWYLVLLFIILIWALWKLYRSPNKAVSVGSWWTWYPSQVLLLAIFAPFVVAGIRGGFATAVRPITISNANQYVDRPIEAALVLNTPFSLYRTIGKDVFMVPEYFTNEQEMANIYSPVHIPTDSIQMPKNKNVVILIVESFGREYIGALNKDLEGGKYKGYTPYVDALISKSTTFKYSFCNGRKSIDGMPSILSSIPMFVEPFFLTPSSMNHVSGIASLLAGEGYHTAFFHGAQRGSMGFMAFARATGFQQYFGREDYDTDKRFGGDNDFDGMWAIWDEPFLQYYATKMSEMKQPFMTAVFTASSHHPYQVPEKYKETYPEEGLEIHKCIRYTDMAIGKFFETASKQPWFKNTIFVLTSDHTNQSDHAYYKSDIGGFCSPIIIYDPSNPIGEVQDKIAQQIDILPTILGLLGYNKPYFGFGIDLLKTPAEDTWAVNYLNGIYQYVKYGHVLQFDGNKSKGLYSLQDSLMQHNLLEKSEAVANSQLSILNSQLTQMETELKAIIQQYMERMTQDRLQP